MLMPTLPISPRVSQIQTESPGLPHRPSNLLDIMNIQIWRLSCKKGVYSILGRFLFFTGLSQFLADRLTLTWKALLHNCVCWSALLFWETMYAKKTQFSERHLLERILPKWILMRRKLKWFLLAASRAQYFIK